MDKYIITFKQELCVRSQKSTKVLEIVVKHNALNKTGRINYNKGGVKDGVGFQPCSASLWIIWASPRENLSSAVANSKGVDQPAIRRSLISYFVIHLL